MSTQRRRRRVKTKPRPILFWLRRSLSRRLTASLQALRALTTSPRGRRRPLKTLAPLRRPSRPSSRPPRAQREGADEVARGNGEGRFPIHLLRSAGWRFRSGSPCEQGSPLHKRQTQGANWQKALTSSSSGDLIIAGFQPDARGKADNQEPKGLAVETLGVIVRPQRPIGGAKRRPLHPRGPIARIRAVRTKNVASGPMIMIWRGRVQRRRRSQRPRLIRTHPSPSFSSFVRYLRNKPTNANSCAVAAESIDNKNGWQTVWKFIEERRNP